MRDSTLIALIGHLVPESGDIVLLQTLWTQVGIHLSHQEMFSPFDWGPQG